MISTALNNHQKPINGSRILFFGVAYKPDIDDARESPALEIMDITAKKGGKIHYHDSFIPQVQTPHGRMFNSVEWSPEALAEAYCVVITTNHKVFNAEMIKRHAKLIVDLRNVIKDSSDNNYKL